MKRQEESSCLQAKGRPRETKPADTWAFNFQNLTNQISVVEVI